MSSKIAYDVYRGTTDRTLRLATMPGAGLPAHIKRKDWVLIPKGKSPLHSDVDRDVAVHGLRIPINSPGYSDPISPRIPM
jgi:hypothetical protein